MSEWGERKVGASKAEVESGRWIAVQKRIFTRWCNAYLKLRKMRIEDLCTDFEDGIKLINLLEILGQEPMKEKYRKTPKMRIHKLENLKAAFHYMTDKNLQLTNTGASDVIEGNEKIILGLIWTLIAKFQVEEISVEGVSGKEALLLWIKHKTAGYDGVDVTNFHRSWKDGLAFCALIHKHRPDIIDYASLSPDNPAENLGLAFQLAEDYFGIDRILDVEDIVDSAKPDEKIVITYVAFVFKGIADFLRRSGYCKAIGKAVNITRKHDEWIVECNEKSAELRAWIDETTAYYTTTEHGNTADVVKAGLDAFNGYKSGVKPEYKKKRAELEGLFSTFYASARNNSRPLFVPAEGLRVEDLRAAWELLENTENEYEQGIRTLYRKFLEVESNLAQFNAKHAKLSEWMNVQLTTFQSGDYGDTLTATDTLITAYEAYESQYEQQQQAMAELREWAASDGIELHEQNESAQQALAEAEASFASVAEQGAQYIEQLRLIREQHDKLGQLGVVYEWMSAKLEFFAAGNYGEALVETNALLVQFQGWPVELAPHKEVLDNMTSEQESITTSIEEQRGTMAQVEEQADVYNTYLLCTQEYFEKTATLEKLNGWINGQNELFNKEKYGSDLAAVNNLLSLFHDTYTSVVQTKRDSLDSMETYQEQLQAAIDETKASLAATEELAAYYENQLQLSQERHEKLPLLDRVEAWTAKQNELFSAADYGDSLDQVKTLIASSKSYSTAIVNQKEILNTMESHQEVIINRLTELQAVMAATEEAGETYLRELVQNQERLETIPTLERVEGWIARQQAVFATDEYGEDLAAVGSLIEEYGDFPTQLALQQETVSGLASEQEVIATKHAAVTSALEAVAEAGDTYHTNLLLNQERFDKLPQLQRVNAWMDQWNAIFFGEEYGDTLQAVDALLSSFNLYTTTKATQAAVAEGMETYQQVILDEIESTKTKLASTEEGAEYYHNQLLLCQERLEKIPALERIDAWLDKQTELFAAADYGDSLQDAELLLSSFDFVKNSIPSNKEVLDTTESYQEVILEKLNATKEKMTEVERLAAEYQLQLQLSAERHEKLPQLERVLGWVARQNELFDGKKYGNSLTDVALLMNAFQETFTAELPVQRETVTAIESGQRAVLEKLEEATTALAAVEEAAAQYSQELNLAKERFEKLPVLDRVEAWLEAVTHVFNVGDYGDDSLDTVNALEASHEESFALPFPAKRAIVDGVSSEQAVIVERIAEVQEQIAEADAGAQNYVLQLKLSKERHEKLPALDRFSGWLDAYMTLFAQQDYGESSLAVVNALIANYKESFELPFNAKRSIVDSLDTEQQAILDRVAEVAAEVTEAGDAGAEYLRQLELCKERHEKLPTLERLEMWLEVHQSVFDRADYGDSSPAAVTAHIANYEESFVLPFPAKKAMADTIESEQQTIVERRDEVLAMCAEVQAAGENYLANLQLSKERHEKLPALDRLEAWLDQHNTVFARADYGDASLTAVNAHIANYEESFALPFPTKKQIVDQVASEQQAILDRVEAIRQRVQATQEAGEEYLRQLHLSKERHQKLPVLERVEAWLAQHEAVFARGDFGDSNAAAVPAHIANYEESFATPLATKQEVVSSVASEQEVVQSRVVEVQARLAKAAEDGAEYLRQLELSKERHEKLPLLDRITQWLDVQLEKFSSQYYGSTMVEVVDLTSSVNSFQSMLALQRTVVTEMLSEQDVVKQRLAEIAVKLEEAEEAGEEYATQLLLSAERLEKLPAIDIVRQWLTTQEGVFAAGEYGDSLVAVAMKLSDHDAFDANLGPQKEVLNQIETYQTAVSGPLEEVKGQASAVEQAAGQYRVNLLLTQEQLEKWPELERVGAWLATQTAVFEAGDYGSNLTEVATKLGEHDTFVSNFAAQSAVVEGMESEQEVLLGKVEELRAALAAVKEAGEYHQNQLLLCQERLEKLPTLARFRAWVAEQSAAFASAVVGDNLVEVDTQLSAYEAFTSAAAAKQETAAAMESYQEEILTPLAECRAELEEVVAAGQGWHTQLAEARERLELLPKLEAVQEWIASQSAVFGKEEYGATLVEVATLLSAYTESYASSRPAMQELLDNMQTEQAAVVEQLEGRKADMAALHEAAEYYESQLLLSQERLEKLPMLDRIEEWIAATSALAASEDFGADLVAVATLLAAYDVLVINLTSKKETLSSMESYQDVINNRKAELNEKVLVLENDLQQYQYQLLLNQERLEKLPTLQRIEAWLTAQLEVFTSGDFGSTLAEVAAKRDVVASCRRGIVPHREAVQGIESYQEVILEKAKEVTELIASVETAATEYEASLDQQKAEIERLKELNKSYNRKADEFSFAVDDLSDKLNTPVAQLLDRLEAQWEQFTSTVKPTLDTVTASYNELSEIAGQLEGDESAFNRYTLTDLYNKYEVVYNRMTEREEELGAALTAERACDALRVEFATLAAAMRQYCDATARAVGELPGSLEEQQAGLEALTAEYNASTQLHELYECTTRLDEAGIVDNPHTRETYHSLYAQWEALDLTFKKASESLQGQLLAASDETITPEQYKEMREVFTHFDADQDAMLNATEFSHCCTGIGLVMTREEVAEKIVELDETGDGCVNFEEFQSFMMERLVEPGHKKEDVLGAFSDLSEKETWVSKRTLVISFTNNDHLDYVITSMPEVEIEGEEETCYEYGGFVEDLFSR